MQPSRNTREWRSTAGPSSWTTAVARGRTTPPRGYRGGGRGGRGGRGDSVHLVVDSAAEVSMKPVYTSHKCHNLPCIVRVTIYLFQFPLISKVSLFLHHYCFKLCIHFVTS